MASGFRVAARIRAVPLLAAILLAMGPLATGLGLFAPRSGMAQRATAEGATAEAAAVEDILDSIVKIEARVPASARSARTLGMARSGSGAVIDGDGLIVTIGYIVTEATDVTVSTSSGAEVPAELVAYDDETGLGLVRTLQAIDVKPIRLGDSDAARARTPAVIAGFGGKDALRGAYVMSRRVFTGYWEYLMEDALYTAPFYESFGGAALLDGAGRLIGIGHVAVPDAAGPGSGIAGNMFVPINRLKAILPEMLEHGRRQGPGRPWLGVQTQEVGGRLFVIRVSADSPAAEAGIGHGDVLLALNGQPLAGQADFYRRLWGAGEPGATVAVTVLQGVGVNTLEIRTVDRRSLDAVGRAN